MARNSLKNITRLLNQEKIKEPEKEFLADLKRSIELDSDKNFRKPSQYYKPSSMNCIRNMWFQRMGVDPDAGESNYRLTGIANSGTDIHERIQGYTAAMKFNGIDCEYVDVASYVTQKNLDYLEIIDKKGFETKLRHKILNLSFMTDGILFYKGQYYILEIKTESSFKWQTRGGVDPKHYSQAIAYSCSFNIPDVIFVYINRDVMDMKAFLFHVTDAMKMDLVAKIEQCENYVNSGEIPPKPEDAGPKLCQYCNYRERCRVY